MGRSGFAHVPNNGAPDQFKTVQRLPTQSSDTPNPFRSGLCTHPQCRLHRSHPPYPCWRLCPFGAERPKMVSGICSSPCTCPCEGPCNRANHASVSHPMHGECRQCPTALMGVVGVALMECVIPTSKTTQLPSPRLLWWRRRWWRGSLLFLPPPPFPFCLLDLVLDAGPPLRLTVMDLFLHFHRLFLLRWLLLLRWMFRLRWLLRSG